MLSRWTSSGRSPACRHAGPSAAAARRTECRARSWRIGLNGPRISAGASRLGVERLVLRRPSLQPEIDDVLRPSEHPVFGRPACGERRGVSPPCMQQIGQRQPERTRPPHAQNLPPAPTIAQASGIVVNCEHGRLRGSLATFIIPRTPRTYQCSLAGTSCSGRTSCRPTAVTAPTENATLRRRGSFPDGDPTKLSQMQFPQRRAGTESDPYSPCPHAGPSPHPLIPSSPHFFTPSSLRSSPASRPHSRPRCRACRSCPGRRLSLSVRWTFPDRILG